MESTFRKLVRFAVWSLFSNFATIIVASLPIQRVATVNPIIIS